MLVLISILLVIIAIGIMNSLWIAIRERTREIGTLRAIGMQRPRVMAMFVIEAFTLGSTGAVSGTSWGWRPRRRSTRRSCPSRRGADVPAVQYVQARRDPDTSRAGVLVIIACTTLIAIIPSIHAARMKPVTAMQHIG